jgi:hypothetical protein
MVRLSKRIAPAFLILGIAVSIGASWHIYRLESAEISSQFQREVDQASTNIEQVLVQSSTALPTPWYSFIVPTQSGSQS